MFLRKKPAVQSIQPGENEKAKGALEVPDGFTVTRHPDPLTYVPHFFVKKHLFETPPSKDDIKTNAHTKHYFLLAAIRSILSLPNGEELIQGMMREEGKRVVVRVFKNSTPTYISIEKTIPIKSNILSPSELWVKMIEKAYVISCNRGYSSLFYASDQLFTAIKFLTGVGTESQFAQPIQHRLRLATLGPTNEEGVYLFNDLMRANQVNQQRRNDICDLVFEKQQMLFDDWCQWLNSQVSPPAPETQANRWREFINHKHPFYYEDFLDFFPSIHAGTSPAIQAAQEWVLKNKILFGKPLTGTYCKEELDLFDAIKKGRSSNKPILVTLPNTQNEPIRAVIGCKEIDNLKYIVLAQLNTPHLFDVAQANDIEESNQKTLELSIFSRLFSTCYVHQSVTPQIIKENLNNYLQVEQARRNRI